jgi:leucyl-tRNA synthetase
MIPFTPHLAHECLVILNCKDVKEWPKIDKQILENINIKIVIQINGKTRDVLSVKKDINEEEINKLVMKNSKTNKYLNSSKINRTIFVKNKIINYILNK